MMKPYLLILMMIWPALVESGESDLRAAFKQAYERVSAGEAQAADYPQLQSYLLFPYLQAAEWSRILSRGSGADYDDAIRVFLAAHRDEPFSLRLRGQWLERLAERGAWQDFLAHLPQAQDEKTRCRAALGRIRLKHPDALGSALALWRYGSLRDKTCIPVFDWLQSSGQLSQARIAERVALAREAGESKLVSFLLGKLEDGADRRQGERWLAGYRSPERFVRDYIHGRRGGASAETAVQIYKRLVRLDPEAGAALYDDFVHKANLKAQVRNELAAWIGYRKILNRQAGATDWYRRAGSAALSELQQQWRLRSAIRVQDWSTVNEWTAELSEVERETARWRYWRARALEALGKEEAKGLYASLAKERSLYGFMSADRIGQDYHLVDRPMAAVAEIHAALLQRPEVQRAAALYALDMQPQAREEWKHLLESTTDAEKQQAALLALEWGWHSQAALSMGRARYWDEMATRFPVVYADQVQSAARREAIPAAWIYGIMRSESLFVEDTRSYAGAIGLMQLMPGTGQLVARKIGWRWRGSSGLKDPDYNIRLGSHYLRMMLDRFDQHIVPATAAYNAGPTNARRWLDEAPMAADVWIETVPFTATHHYLLHVLEYTVVYGWRLTGKPPSLKKLLVPVPGRGQID